MHGLNFFTINSNILFEQFHIILSFSQCVWCCNMMVCVFCLFCFSVVYLVRAVNPRISNLTAAAAETYANISWEYEGPEHVKFYVEYGVAGSKT